MKMTVTLATIMFCAGCLFGALVSEYYGQKDSIKNCENCHWFTRAMDEENGAMEMPIRGDDETSTPTCPTEIQVDEKVDCTVDIDGLILTESGGNPNAVGDGGKSRGLGQMGRAAWQDVNDHHGWECDYDRCWNDAGRNRLYMDAYVNEVIPEKYFKAWHIPDNVHARIAAYKYGPSRFREIYKAYGCLWSRHVSDTVRRDLNKYDLFVIEKESK